MPNNNDFGNEYLNNLFSNGGGGEDSDNDQSPNQRPSIGEVQTKQLMWNHFVSIASVVSLRMILEQHPEADKLKEQVLDVWKDFLVQNLDKELKAQKKLKKSPIASLFGNFDEGEFTQNYLKTLEEVAEQAHEALFADPPRPDDDTLGGII